MGSTAPFYFRGFDKFPLPEVTLLPEFSNEPFTDFSVDANRNAFRAALTKIEKRLPIQGRNVIGGKTVPRSTSTP
jgi:hypothetical protein